MIGYDNRGLDVDDINVEEGAAGNGKAKLVVGGGNGGELLDTPPTEPMGGIGQGGHSGGDSRAGSAASSSSRGGDKEDQTEMDEKKALASEDMIENESYNTKL